MPTRRPNFNKSVRALIEDISERMPEFAHVKAARILTVAGDARRASRATVRPLMFPAGKTRDAKGNRRPTVRVGARRMLYVITLRPLFFRDSTPKGRIGTLLHELFHISRTFDGTLDLDRRHARLGTRFTAELRPLLRRYLRACPKELLAAFSHNGEVLIAQWLERPPASYEKGQKGRRLYTEDQLFTGRVRMITRRTRAARPPAATLRFH